MSFLDNLENNLKSLESRDETMGSNARRREADRSDARAAAPWAERLKKCEFAKTLMQQTTRAGFQMRTKVHITWIGAALRLEARGERLELQPAPDGVFAVIRGAGRETARQKVNLDGDPDALVKQWMALVADRKRLDDEAAAVAEIED